MNQMASLGFIMFYHLFSSDLCLLPFTSLPHQSFSNKEMSPAWDRGACYTQLFGWMMYHQGLGLQSGHVLFLLQQHQQSLNISDL